MTRIYTGLSKMVSFPVQNDDVWWGLLQCVCPVFVELLKANLKDGDVPSLIRYVRKGMVIFAAFVAPKIRALYLSILDQLSNNFGGFEAVRSQLNATRTTYFQAEGSHPNPLRRQINMICWYSADGSRVLSLRE